MTTRRVVTGIDNDGKSYAVHDGETTGIADVGMVMFNDVWVDDPARPDPRADVDPVAGDLALSPPSGGSVVRVVTFRPESVDAAELDARLRDGSVGVDVGDAIASEEDLEEGWHTTATIDYGIVLSGRIELGLDSGWTELGPGDVVVQRATRHAWRPIGGEPATMAFVLIASPNYA